MGENEARGCPCVFLSGKCVPKFSSWSHYELDACETLPVYNLAGVKPA